ncbi:SDR family NAD(P)-dependent oxidoreductase [Candidatus Uhrbacteria bacterium]|nr:MAG: SDR family NAD(P)-dependent oxidoreductase [Candidatus Uhrbacteria bacterium]
MKKILITGGAGFIGSHLARHLLADPQNVLIITDNLQRGRMDADLTSLLERDKDRVRFIQADLTDKAAWDAFDTDVDHLYHLAAINGTKHFYKIPHEVLRINILTLMHALDWAGSLSKKPKVLFTSSNEAYAGGLSAFNQLPIPTPEQVPLVIEDVYNPRWTYASTKLIGEQFVIWYAKHHGFSAVIVRPHNFYGPRAGYDHVIPEFSERIMKRTEPFEIFGADDTRTFCYITDAVRAMQMIMDHPVTDGDEVHTFHIGDREEINIRGLAEKLFRSAGWTPSEIKIHPSPAGSVKRRLADISKTCSLIGWEPEVSLDHGLHLTYEWYVNNPKPESRA